MMRGMATGHSIYYWARSLPARIVSIFFSAQPMHEQLLAQFGQLVFDARRHLGIHLAAYDPVSLHRTERDGQHPLRNIADRALNVAEPQSTIHFKGRQNQDRPLVAQPRKNISHGTVPARFKNVSGVPATALAEEKLGMKVVANVIMFGALARITGWADPEACRKAIRLAFANTLRKNWVIPPFIRPAAWQKTMPPR